MELGDRVKVISLKIINGNVIPSHLLNETGTICKLFIPGNMEKLFAAELFRITELVVGVEFDQHMNLHNCAGSAKSGHGYFLYEKSLRKTNQVLKVKDWLSRKK